MSDDDNIQFGDYVILKKPPEPAPPDHHQRDFIFFLFICLVIYLVLRPAPDATDTVTRAADSTLECKSHFNVGQMVHVVNVGTVRMRLSPGHIGKSEVDTIYYMTIDDRALVKTGPSEMDGLCWWLLEHEGSQGWTADHTSGGLVILLALP